VIEGRFRESEVRADMELFDERGKDWIRIQDLERILPMVGPVDISKSDGK